MRGLKNMHILKGVCQYEDKSVLSAPVRKYYTVYCTLEDMYIIHCSVHCAKYRQCTMYIVQCTVYSVQCTVYTVQCRVYSVQCTVCSVRWGKKGDCLMDGQLESTQTEDWLTLDWQGRAHLGLKYRSLDRMKHRNTNIHWQRYRTKDLVILKKLDQETWLYAGPIGIPL